MGKVLMAATVPWMLRVSLLPLAKELAGDGWTIDAAANGTGGDARLAEGFNSLHQISWSRSPLAVPNFTSAPRQFREVVTQNAYDIVHVNTPVAAFIGRFSLRTLRSPPRASVIYTCHGFHFHSARRLLENLPFRLLEQLAGRWTDYLVVVNEEDFREAERLRLVPKDRLMLIPGVGVDLTRFSATKAQGVALRRALGIDQTATVFAVIGEFTPQKRQRDVVRALVRSGDPSLVCLLVGSGPCLEDTTTLARELGIKEQVRALGFRDDVPQILRASDALILPSEREGFPGVVLEAFASDVPVIGSEVRGTRDLLAGGRGLLFPVGDVEQLAANLSLVANKEASFGEMVRKARRFAEEHSVQRIAQMYTSLYERAIEELRS